MENPLFSNDVTDWDSSRQPEAAWLTTLTVRADRSLLRLRQRENTEFLKMLLFRAARWLGPDTWKGHIHLSKVGLSEGLHVPSMYTDEILTIGLS